MNQNQLMKRATVLLAALSVHTAVLASDIVKRQLRLENEILWVEDILQITEEFAMRQAEMWHLFREGRSGNTNLMRYIQDFLDGESLEIQKYDATYREDRLHLSVVSKVGLMGSKQPAKLRWISTFGGKQIHFGSITLGRSGSDLLIFRGNGQFALWFPDLGLADELLPELEEFTKMLESFFAGNVQYESTIRIGNRVEPLFCWDQGKKATHGASADLVREMHRTRSMSCNDLLNLYTTVKVAKAGYYRISTTVAE